MSNYVSMIYLATSVEVENLGISMHHDNLSIHPLEKFAGRKELHGERVR